MADLLSALNPVQQQAVLHGDGPLLILAGAGSGKTRTLTHRVAHVIAERGVEPWRILAVTFTNKAAAEMRDRLERLLGNERLPWVSTFHAACVRILRREIEALGFARDFTIYDDRDSERLVKDILADLDIPEGVLAPRLARSLIDGAKNKGITAGRVRAPARAARIDGAGVPALPGPAEARERGRFRRPVAAHHRSSSVSTPRCSTVTAAASCTSSWTSTRTPTRCSTASPTCWRRSTATSAWSATTTSRSTAGAAPRSRNILEFERDYPDVITIRLEQNYRSTGTILAAAGAVVARNARRKGKTLWTENPRGDKVAVAPLSDDLEEARFVAREIERALRGPWTRREIAILYRTNAQSRAVEEALVRHRIPYVMIGGVQVLRARRGEGRPRLPARAAESGRLAVHQAHHQHAGARHRARHRRAPSRRSTRRRAACSPPADWRWSASSSSRSRARTCAPSPR